MIFHCCGSLLEIKGGALMVIMGGVAAIKEVPPSTAIRDISRNSSSEEAPSSQPGRIWEWRSVQVKGYLPKSPLRRKAFFVSTTGASVDLRSSRSMSECAVTITMQSASATVRSSRVTEAYSLVSTSIRST